MKMTAVADVEGDVKFGGRLGEIGLPALQQLGDRPQEGRHQQDADQPVDEIAERQPVARGIVAAGAFEHRIDGAAEIGAEHQRQRAHRAR